MRYDGTDREMRIDDFVRNRVTGIEGRIERLDEPLGHFDGAAWVVTQPGVEQWWQHSHIEFVA